MSEQSLKQKTVQGVIWSSIDRFSVQLIQLVIGIVIARILSPSDYGMVAMLIFFMAISSLLVDSGFSNALIQKKDPTEADFSTAFYCNVAIAFICYILLFALAPLIASFYKTEALSPILRVYAISLIFNSLCLVGNVKLIREFDFKKKTIINMASVMGSGCIGLGMAIGGCGVWALVVQYVAASAITWLSLLIFVRWKPLFLFSKASFNHLFKFGSKLLGGSFLNTVTGNLYTLLLGRFFPSDQVGYYTRGLQVPNVLANTLTSVTQSVSYPVFSNLQGEKEQLVAAHRRFVRFTGFFIIPSMLILMIVSGPFVRYFLTEKWEPSIVLMQWICLARIFTPFGFLNQNVLNAIGRPDLSLKIDLLKLPLSFIALIVTIPMGIKVVIVGHFVLSVISFFINAYFPGKILGYGSFKQLKDLFSIFVCSVITGIVLIVLFHFIHSDLLKIILSILVGGGVYYLLAYLSKFEEIKELNFMLDNLKKRFVHKN